ncbi:uncharacterized protein FOMMEDRAFT_160675 [Fomitiporia mediterranea MF3/22]|uniref:uncharacterized protein n=1 Tax=Fomitiporia mediterranea (strain MF3/22) TaxID=694068 RepID=UPI00044084D6|nr:uncharacterized protein FOMMEDRAFT_160675 [Fomitiporia mediterranea MF3/22]EJC99114.1 hypothetical protein FOMMEDRAFT_160675 [Fomitiporia mediterranea MF3/22]
MPVSYKTTLEEDRNDPKNWKLILTEDGAPAYYEYRRTIVKSPQDDREYRIIRLLNQLEATLVCDRTADKAAACMDVAVGTASDPEDMLGTAHFCEHLWYMGTEKNKQKDAFDKYMSLHSGMTNAYTYHSDTKYFFSINSEDFDGGLKLFSQPFYCPSFHEDSIQTEAKTIDSEYVKFRQTDTWRLLYIEISLASPEHPLRKFGTGNKRTLIDGFLETPSSAKSGGSSRSSKITSKVTSQSVRKGVREAAAKKITEEAEAAAALVAREKLFEWWKREYSACRMSLAVIGKESLNDLTNMVVQYFTPIRNDAQQNPTPFVSSEQPFGKRELCKIVYVKTLVEMHRIKIAIPVPWQDNYWRERPADFLIHLLGHEGRGSLYSYLKMKGWLLELVAEVADFGRGINTITLQLDLTENGFKNHRIVVVTCFKFINFLRNSKFPEWMWEEQNKLNELSFRFKEKGSAVSYALDIASHMKLPVPRALVLNGSIMSWEWNEKLVRDTLNKLDIENCYVIVAAKKHDQTHGQSWQTEPWYGAEYIKKPLDAKLIAHARKDNDINSFTLPVPNIFIPENFDVHYMYVERPKKRPDLIKSTSLMQAWHKKDDQFWLPHAFVNISARTPVAGASSQCFVLTKIFTELVKDALTEFAFDAHIAGLDYELEATTRGFTLTVKGYNDKLHLLTKGVLSEIKEITIRKDRLEIIVERVRKEFKKLKYGAPCDLSKGYLYDLTDNNAFNVEEKLEALEGINIQKLKNHVEALLSKLFFEVLVSGNMQKQDALNLASQVEEAFQKPVQADKIPKNRSCTLNKGCNYILDLTAPIANGTSSSLCYYCQVGNVSNQRTRVTFYLLAQILQEPTFTILRVNEQLGYACYSRPMKGAELVGWHLVIQSEMDTKYLEWRVEKFLEHMHKRIKEMSREKFKSHKKSLGDNWKEKLKTIKQEGERFWDSIEDGYQDFQQNEKDAKLLQSHDKSAISLNDVLQMFEQYLYPESLKRSKLSIHMHSQKPPKPAPLHVSIRASKEFLEVLLKGGISIDRDEYSSTCELEPSMSQFQKFLEEMCGEGVKELFGKLDSLAEKYPVEIALKGTDIKDCVKFKRGLSLSRSATPVQQ